MSSASSSMDSWLRRGIQAALILLLGLCCFLIYRIAMVVYRVEQSVAVISADVRQVTGTVAQLSRDVNSLRGDIVGLKDKVKDSVPLDEARRAVDEAVAMGASLKANAPTLSAAGEQEIQDLLAAVLTSGGRAEVGGKDESVLTLYAALYARYKLKRNTLTSAEDFIDQVAAESILGKPYALVDQSGNHTPLSDWMKDRLKQMRAKH